MTAQAMIDTNDEANPSVDPVFLPVSLRRARQVVRQRTKLAYVAPRVVSGRTPVPAGSAIEEAVTPLRTIREQRGLSVTALARRSGVSFATIYRIERGATTPRPHIVREISEALGVVPSQVAEFCSTIAAGSRLAIQ
jgi:ribosome-binding protein aMBF1 (putative translation factor)